MIIGVLAGLWAAFFQSLSYLASRHFMHVHSGGTRKLLVLSHVWMGAASWALLPLVWPADGVPWSKVALPIFGTSFFYVLGQIGLLIALRRAQPTQVAPMLALKLLVLACMTVALKGESIQAIQWVSVAFCVAGTFILNYSHDRLKPFTFVTLLLTCFFYAISDWSIGFLTPAFGKMDAWRAIMCGSLLCYGLCGLAAVPFMPFYGSRKWSDWKDAAPYSAAWLTAALGLFASFALVGVIYGGMLQSTRSIMGVFMAAMLTKLGHTHIEHMKSPEMFIRRLVAAVLMTLAIILWGYGRL